MNNFYKFASENPILTFLLFLIIGSSVASMCSPPTPDSPCKQTSEEK